MGFFGDLLNLAGEALTEHDERIRRYVAQYERYDDEWLEREMQELKRYPHENDRASRMGAIHRILMKRHEDD